MDTNTDIQMAATVLRAARALVERGWAQGADARDDCGHPVHATHPAAQRWSALGALTAAALPVDAPPEWNHVQALTMGALALADASRAGSLDRWNDAPERTREEVLAMFDRAIDDRK